MTALQWIVKEAKAIKKKFPRRFTTWREYVAQASAIYAKKHKGHSPVGKKKTAVKRKPAAKKVAHKKKLGAVTTRSKSHTDKNKITANIQVGAVSVHTSDIRKYHAMITAAKSRIEKMRAMRKLAKTASEKTSYAQHIKMLMNSIKAYKANISHLKKLI